MSGRRKSTPPPWLDLSQPLNDHPRTGQCARCGAPVLRALVGNPAGVNVAADPWPLDAAAELPARLAGRFTYCLRLHPFLPARITHRSPEHIAAGTCRHHVIADHQCTTPAAVQPHPATQQPATDRLF